MSLVAIVTKILLGPSLVSSIASSNMMRTVQARDFRFCCAISDIEFFSSVVRLIVNRVSNSPLPAGRPRCRRLLGSILVVMGRRFI